MVRQLVQVVVRNSQYKLLSVVVALTAWLWVQGDQVHEAKVKVPVVWEINQGLMAADQLPENVTLALRGTRAATRKAAEAGIRVRVDISESPVGPQKIEFVDFAPGDLPPGIEVTGYSPSRVAFFLDEVFTKRLAVKAQTVGEPAPGHKIAELKVTPQVIQVRGPRTVVAGLREVTTAGLDVSDMTDNGVRTVSLDLPRAVEMVDASIRLEASIAVVPVVEQRPLNAVPVFVWGRTDWVPSQAVISVTLEGPVDAMQDLTANQIVSTLR